jgi:hypothetical protein
MLFPIRLSGNTSLFKLNKARPLPPEIIPVIQTVRTLFARAKEMHFILGTSFSPMSIFGGRVEVVVSKDTLEKVAIQQPAEGPVLRQIFVMRLDNRMVSHLHQRR